MKQCTKCKQFKEKTEFHKSSHTNDCLRYTCKECENKYMKNYYNQRPEGRFRRLKANAIRRGTSFLITEAEFVYWFNNQELKCFYCKTPLDFVYGNHWQWNGLTIDRSEPNGAYAINNIVLSCRRCNIIKGHWFNKKQMLEIAGKYLVL